MLFLDKENIFRKHFLYKMTITTRTEAETMDEVRMHHLKCKPGEIGKYVILPGDPGRGHGVKIPADPYMVNALAEALPK